MRTRHGVRQVNLRVSLLAAIAALAVVAPSASSADFSYAIITSPAVYDFGGQQVGTASNSATFTLRVHCDQDSADMSGNTCLNPHPFTPTVTVSGPFAIQDNGCTSMMPGSTPFGTTCTFKVVFRPSTAGAADGIVDVGEPVGFGKAYVKGTGIEASPSTSLPVGNFKKCKKKRSKAARKKCRKKQRLAGAAQLQIP